MSLNPGQFGKGEQLKMFMTPREITKYAEFSDTEMHDASDFDDGRTETDMMIADKRANIERTGFDKRIAAEGIREPISINHNDFGRRAVTDGHHRIVATMGTPRFDQLAPVVHHENAADESAWGKMRKREGAEDESNW